MIWKEVAATTWETHSEHCIIAWITDIDDGDLAEVTECLPLLGDVLLVSHDHDVLEFAEEEVAGAQRHDEVP